MRDGPMVGDRVKLMAHGSSLREGTGVVVHVFPMGEKPKMEDVVRFYGEDCPGRHHDPRDFTRWVVQRDDTKMHVVLPKSFYMKVLR